MQTNDRPKGRRSERGQMLALAALSMLALVAGTALVIEAGNAYAQQRVVQNSADSLANAGATVLAERLGGASSADWDAAVETAMDRMRDANGIESYTAYYTNVTGDMLTPAGTVTADVATASIVGGGAGQMPPNPQGVRVGSTTTFPTALARVIGFTQFRASADATAVTGALTGGQFLPIVFPVSMANCDGSGNLVVDLDAKWRMSDPGTPHPDGQEWLVPLCKTGTGSFMFLDLDDGGPLDCYDEVMTPPSVEFNEFPAYVSTDTGADCQKKVAKAIADKNLQGSVVTIPICDDDCSTTGGSKGKYKIIRVTAFFIDYISYSNNPTNTACALEESPTYGTDIENIVDGNGSAACIAGWFVRLVTSGPVGSGTITAGEAIGVQLIK